MNYSEYTSCLLEQVRNSVKDINTIAENETFEFFEKCVPTDVVKKAGSKK